MTPSPTSPSSAAPLTRRELRELERQEAARPAARRPAVLPPVSDTASDVDLSVETAPASAADPTSLSLATEPSPSTSVAVVAPATAAARVLSRTAAVAARTASRSVSVVARSARTARDVRLVSREGRTAHREPRAVPAHREPRAVPARREPGSVTARREPVSVTARREPTARRVPSTTLRSVVALSFAALLAAATSLAAVTPAESFAYTPTIEAAPDAQELLTASGDPASVWRDTYGATTPEQLAQARAAARAAEVAAKVAAIGFRTASTYTNNPDSAVQWPFPVGVPISDGFGPRSSPGGIGSTNHKGVDFTPGQGKPIGAVAAGVVSLVQSSDSGGLGVYVVVDHVIDGQNVSSWYGHMLSGSPTVSVGDVVVPGQQLGSVGNTGTSTGAHLHLEIHVDDTAVDPIAWLTARN